MKALVLLCATFSIAFSAPTQSQQEAIIELYNNLFESRTLPINSLLKDATSEDLLAEIEQKTWKGLLGNLLDSGNQFVQNKLSSGGGGGRRKTPSTFKGLLGSWLNTANRFAQNKLSPSELEEIASIEQENWKHLFSDILGRVHDFAQSHLAPRIQEEEEERQREMAEIEQETLKELFRGYLDSIKGYARDKLSDSRDSGSDGKTFKELLGELLDYSNQYARNKLSQPSAETLG